MLSVPLWSKTRLWQACWTEGPGKRSSFNLWCLVKKRMAWLSMIAFKGQKGVTTCYTLDSVILRPVMSMKLSQPGCVGSIERISSIGSLHLIALFFYYFFKTVFPDFDANLCQQPSCKLMCESMGNLSLSPPYSARKLQLSGWCEHVRPSSFSSWHWCGAPWTFRSGNYLCKRKI